MRRWAPLGERHDVETWRGLPSLGMEKGSTSERASVRGADRICRVSAEGALANRRHVRARPWLGFIAAGCLLALAAIVFVAWMWMHWGGTEVTTAVDDIGEAVAAAVASVGAGLAAIRTQGRLRRAWTLLSASALSWCLGEVVWSVYEVGLGLTVPTPSAADIGFLSAVPLAVAGVVSFSSSARGTATGPRLWLDRAIVFLSLLFVGWELGLDRVVMDASAPIVSRLVNIAYPVGDILIGTVLILAIRRATNETHGRLLLLLGGLAANSIADSTFAYLNLTDSTAYVLDAGWVVGYLMIALAAQWPSSADDRTTETKPIDMWQLVLPWLAILAGGLAAMVLAFAGRPLDTFATVLAAAVILLLMVSQVSAHYESLGLLLKSRLSEAVLSDVISHAPLGIVRIAPDMTILELNPSFSDLLRSPAGDLVGANIERFFPADEMRLVCEKLHMLATHSVESIEIETQGTRSDSTPIWLRWTATLVETRDGTVDYFLAMFEDVSERRSTEEALKAAYSELEGLVLQRTAELRSANERLANEAVSDPLTGLYNRRYLGDFVEREISRTRRTGSKIAFAMVDIDHFKRINDTLGHDAGDEVLRQVSSYLTRQIRQEDLAFRYGGEEFLLVLPCVTLAGITARVERICTDLATLSAGENRLALWPLTLSIGVAVFPDDGDSAETVIRCADAALYRAKDAGRNRVAYHVARATQALRLSVSAL